MTSIPYNLIRYISFKVRERGGQCSAEYLRQITKADRRPSPKLAIHLEAVTGVHRDNWCCSPQPMINTRLQDKFPPTGDWVMFDEPPPNNSCNPTDSMI